MRLFNFVILFLAFIFSGVPVASFFVSAGQNVTIAPYSNTTLICAVYDAGNASMPFSFSWEQSKGPAVADLFGKYTEAVFVLVSSEGEYGASDGQEGECSISSRVCHSQLLYP
mmetsp:Transcript_52318/g.86936  ORF Transcript_52318/g.86936 Transcript_52318/m.86936 type:complete len:113 (+) Transcript_52318:120-458(+)